MKEWKEMSLVRKVALILVFLSLVARLTLAILAVKDVLTDVEIFQDIIGCVNWLSLGVVCWNKEELHPKVCFVLAAINLICIFR